MKTTRSQKAADTLQLN